MGFPIPPVSLNAVLGQPMTHRFGVFFFAAGWGLNPLDIRFQEVSGLQAAISTRADESAAAQMFRKVIPTGIEYGDLVLKRGMVLGSPLAQQVQLAFNDFKLYRSDVLVTIFSEMAVPTGAFVFAEAYPIAWELGGLNASGQEVLVESLTLTYTRARTLSLS
jgi:phage tail-like protein